MAAMESLVRREAPAAEDTQHSNTGPVR